MEVSKTPRIVENRVVKDEDEESDDEETVCQNVLHPEVNISDSACEDLSDDESKSTDDMLLADGLLDNMAPRMRNFLMRFMSGFGLLGGFAVLVWLGPVGLIFLGYSVLIKSYKEILDLGFKMCHIKDSKTKIFTWHLFLLLVYHMVGPGSLTKISESMNPWRSNPYVDGLAILLDVLVEYHTIIIFGVYFSYIVWFVTTMNDGNYLGRYAILAWSHTSLFFTVIPVHLLFITLLEGGMIFFIVPMIVITINDITAFYVGFYCGKTPLIKLSPKKTMEGYLGGGLLTLILGTAFSMCCSFYTSLTCPIEVNALGLVHSDGVFFVTDCKPSPIYKPSLTLVSGMPKASPFIFHSFIISVFAAILGPFGGFFASGFKRACNRKNFGSLIPGHGGVLDRCDCMFLMAAFIHVYFELLKKLELIDPSD